MMTADEIGKCFIQSQTSVAMSTIWLFLACCTDYVFSHSKFQNVAYSKQVTLSSQYEGNIFPGSNAVNGLVSDFACTDWEKSPWLKINRSKIPNT